MVRPEPGEPSREAQHRGRVCRLRTVRHGRCAGGQPRGSRGEAAVGCRIPGHWRAFAVPADRQGPVSLAHGVLNESLREWRIRKPKFLSIVEAVSYTHLRAHETRHDIVCRLLLEK